MAFTSSIQHPASSSHQPSAIRRHTSCVRSCRRFHATAGRPENEPSSRRNRAAGGGICGTARASRRYSAGQVRGMARSEGAGGSGVAHPRRRVVAAAGAQRRSRAHDANHRSRGRGSAAAPIERGVKTGGRSGGFVDAPGKKHRKPVADTPLRASAPDSRRIATIKTVKANRRRGRG